ncbi:hypothetical protein B0H13DRAFT_2675828 [Mycena leptocephala]|nr:hypothetical protein B0H13DRAFT_2675828 [Mycena leptocephala]
MSSCQHALNTDISGIGVRVSFYLQTLFLGCLSARSGSLDEIAGALYTLMATNTAMAVTGLILGLKSQPEISFQDGVVIIYLLSMAWITVIFSLASCNRLFGDTKILQLVSVIQSYVIVAFAVVVLGTAPRFGKSPGCNPDAVAVIFRPFSASKSGRIVGWIIVGLMVIGYTVMTARDYTARVIRKIKARKQCQAQSVPLEPQPRPKPQAPTLLGLIQPPTQSEPPQAGIPLPRRSTNYGTKAKLLVDWDLLFTLCCIIVFWAFFVLNTELVIRWNQPNQAESGPRWQFGQILPMFLTLLPSINMVTAFSEFGVMPTKQVDRPTKVSIVWDVRFEARQMQST